MEKKTEIQKKQKKTWCVQNTMEQTKSDINSDQI